jgi:hypothetical protein
MTKPALPVVAALAALVVSACSEAPEQALANRWPMLTQYCTDCHNDNDLAGGMSLQHVTTADVAANPKRWEEVVRRLRGSLMPPPGNPHPTIDQARQFVAALEVNLDAAAAQRGAAPGRTLLHRLNRVEYATAVEDLLGVSVDPAKLLPPDATSDGFDNVAEVLRVTPTYLDQYIAAAREVSIKAVGNPQAPPTRAEYVAKNQNHTTHVAGLPLGTRDGLVVEHYFPADGQYVFRLSVTSASGAELRYYPQGWLAYEHTGILTIDGRRVFEAKLGGTEELRNLDRYQIVTVNAIKDRFRDIRVNVKAGYHKVGAAFVARSHAESDYALQRFTPGEGVPDVPWMAGFEVVGPYEPTGISVATRSRERIFTCQPKAPSEELPCAEQILSRLARLAFRRPTTETEIERLLAFYRAGQASGGFEAGVQKGLLAILSSTYFLYRAEPGGPPAGIEPGAVYAVSDLELASRLAFFLWSEGPDDELLALADGKQLSDSRVYSQLVARMLADPRSRSLVTNFAFLWLSVRGLDVIDPDPTLYPNFDEELRRGFVGEMERFLDSILRDDKRSVLELLDAKHTFVNERLARHYGIPGVRGDRFRRVELDDPRRFGLFGKGSVLLATSYPDRTSPVLRGAWIMEHLLGTPPQPPPPGVSTNLAPLAVEQPHSVRERLQLHRTLSSCNGCHGVIDPLGQALENYNAVGEWRTFERDSGAVIDPTGKLANGRPVSSPIDLRETLLADPDQFVQTVVQNLMTYALGRRVEYYDMPAVRAIVRDAKRAHSSFPAIVKGVAASVPFRMRTAPEIVNDRPETVAAATGASGGGN